MPFPFFENNDIDWLKKKVEENPASIFHARLADYYLRQKDYEHALEHAQKSVVLHPDYPSAHWVLAKCYYERQEYDKANKSLQELLRLDPLHPAALRLSCELMKQVGDTLKAKEYLRRILEIDPGDKEVAHQLAEEDRSQPSGQQTPSAGIDMSVQSEPAVSDAPQETAMTSGMPAPEAQEQTLESTWDISQFTFLQPETTSSASDSESTVFSPMTNEPTPETEEMQPPESTIFPPISGGQSIGIEEIQQPEQPPLDWLHETKSILQPEVHEFPTREEANAEPEPSPAQSESQVEPKEPPEKDENFDLDFMPQDSNLQDERRQFEEMLEQIFSDELYGEEQQEKQEQTLIQNAANGPETEEEKLTDFSFDEFYSEGGASNEMDSWQVSQEPLFEDAHSPAAEVEEDKHNQEDLVFGPYDTNQNETISAQPQASTPESQKDETTSRIAEIEKLLAGLDIRDDALLQEASQKEVEPPQEPFQTTLQRPSSAAEEDYPPAEEAETVEQSTDRSTQTQNEPEEEKNNRRSSTRFITPTLGEIYASQGQYAKAIGVFENLLKNDPQNFVYRQKLEWLRQKLQEQQLLGSK